MDQPDALLPWFIILELPAGVAGLLIAGIFAASMSSLEGSLNSMSTILVTDFYKRFHGSFSDKKALKLGKTFVVLLGVFGTACGLILATHPIQSLYDKFFELIGLFGGGLGGLFLLGMMTVRGSVKGVLIGFILSAVFQFYISNYTSLNFFTYLFFGMTSCFILGYIFSIIFPDHGKSLEGLTVHT
jgi:Na+/proline symporter